MTLPQVPLGAVITIGIFFIILILFTDIRYKFCPDIHISNGTVFASLVIGFILLYTMQKFDTMDLNVPTVSRSIIYLKKIALKYEPKAVCYLIKYCQGFLDIDDRNYALECFERMVVPKIDTEVEKERVFKTVSRLNNIYFQRVSLTNTIAEPIWYLVFLSTLILTIIFPMNNRIPRMDALLVLLLIWFPVVFIYALYISELDALVNIIEETIEELKKCEKGISGYCDSLKCRYKCKK